MNRIYLNEGVFDNTVSKVFGYVKQLINRSKDGDDTVKDDAKEIKDQIESGTIKIPNMIKTIIIGILMGLISATSANAFTFNFGDAYKKMEKQVAAAEAKYGKNFGSVTTYEKYAPAVERIAAMFDSKHDYGVHVKNVKKINQKDGTEAKVYKFDDNGTAVFLNTGDIMIYDSDGDVIGEFLGNDANKIILKAKALINKTKNGISEAKRILTRAGYTLLKD